MKNKGKILILGGAGFVGTHLSRSLSDDGWIVEATSRNRKAETVSGSRQHTVKDLSTHDIQSSLFDNVDLVIQLAAPVNSKVKAERNMQSETEKIAQNVSRAVCKSPVPRMIILSSVAARLANDDIRSARLYGIDKLAADKVFLEHIPSTTSLVILRPPMIYGHRMKGALRSLSQIVRRGWIVPLGSANAQRSYLSVDNLNDLICTMANADNTTWRQANRKIYEPSDNKPIATNTLVNQLKKIHRSRTILVPVSNMVLKTIGIFIGKTELVSGALDSVLCRQEPSLKRDFGWVPKIQMPESLSFLETEQ